jgi:hypothetical protein
VRSTLDELTKELDELRALVSSIAPVNSALAGHQDLLVRKYITIRRRFDNGAFSVALYASFEKFIENLVAAYAHLESRRVQYSELPQKLVKNHLSRTAEMLSRGRIGEGRYIGLTEIDVVKNLFECLSGVSPYTLNEAAVVAHDLNLRVSEIDKLFTTVGIEEICNRVRRADALLQWYCEVKELRAAPQDGVPAAVIEERIKDLVERRNQIAHRGGNPLDLLGVSEMIESIAYIQAFSRSVFAMAIGRYLQDHHAASRKSMQLTQCMDDGPYQKGKVVVVEQPAQRLFVGQPVFVLVETIGARWGRIQGLKIDETTVKAVELNEAAPNGVGIELDFKCPKGAGLIALNADDDVVWSPLEVTAAAAAA